MEHNVYAPPMAAVADVQAVEEASTYYVVGKRKFFVLNLLTLGLFQIVWFYLHWANFKRTRKVPMWPVARSLFSVFFTHSLTEEIAESLKRAGLRHAWSPGGAATSLVLLNILAAIWGRAGDYIVGETNALAITLGLLVLVSCVCWRIQRAANVACGRPEGETNQRFTVINWFWIIPGGLLLLFVLLGIAAGYAGVEG